MVFETSTIQTLSIGQNFPIEVMAVPQGNVMASSSSSKNPNPMNVKIKIRNKDVKNQRGIISVPKLTLANKNSEKVLLTNSDQTIMSFDLLMEKDVQKTSKKRSQKNIFQIFKPGTCLGSPSDEDEYPYVPTTQENSNEATSFEARKVDEFILKKNYPTIYSSSTYPKSSNPFLGKCKPGGCLDPPFGEDKYPYERKNDAEKNHSKQYTTTYSIKPDANSNTDLLNEIQPRTKSINEVDSLIQVKSDKNLHENDYNQIITYPTPLLENILQVRGDSKDKKRRRSEDKPRKSLNEIKNNLINAEKDTKIPASALTMKQKRDSFGSKNSFFDATNVKNMQLIKEPIVSQLDLNDDSKIARIGPENNIQSIDKKDLKKSEDNNTKPLSSVFDITYQNIPTTNITKSSRKNSLEKISQIKEMDEKKFECNQTDIDNDISEGITNILGEQRHIQEKIEQNLSNEMILIDVDDFKQKIDSEGATTNCSICVDPKPKPLSISTNETKFVKEIPTNQIEIHVENKKSLENYLINNVEKKIGKEIGSETVQEVKQSDQKPIEEPTEIVKISISQPEGTGKDIKELLFNGSKLSNADETPNNILFSDEPFKKSFLPEIMVDKLGDSKNSSDQIKGTSEDFQKVFPKRDSNEEKNEDANQLSRNEVPNNLSLISSLHNKQNEFISQKESKNLQNMMPNTETDNNIHLAEDASIVGFKSPLYISDRNDDLDNKMNNFVTPIKTIYDKNSIEGSNYQKENETITKKFSELPYQHSYLKTFKTGPDNKIISNKSIDSTTYTGDDQLILETQSYKTRSSQLLLLDNQTTRTSLNRIEIIEQNRITSRLEENNITLNFKESIQVSAQVDESISDIHDLLHLNDYMEKGYSGAKDIESSTSRDNFHNKLDETKKVNLQYSPEILTESISPLDTNLDNEINKTKNNNVQYSPEILPGSISPLDTNLDKNKFNEIVNLSAEKDTRGLKPSSDSIKTGVSDAKDIGSSTCKINFNNEMDEVNSVNLHYSPEILPKSNYLLMDTNLGKNVCNKTSFIPAKGDSAKLHDIIINENEKKSYDSAINKSEGATSQNLWKLSHNDNLLSKDMYFDSNKEILNSNLINNYLDSKLKQIDNNVLEGKECKGDLVQEPKQYLRDKGSVILNLGFQTYDDVSGKIVNSFNPIFKPLRQPNDIIKIVRSTISTNNEPIQVHINSKVDLLIRIKENETLTHSKESNKKQQDIFKSTSRNKMLHDHLNTMYECNLIAVEKVIRSLRQEIDSVAQEKQVIRKIAIKNKIKSKKIYYLNKKCQCFRH